MHQDLNNQGSRQIIRGLSLVLCFWLLSTLCVHAAETPPNIVLIVSDDQGYQDLGCFGSQEVITPHLDRLAKEGARLTNFYVTWPACTPSRGSLLTGRYPQRNGVYDMIRNEAPDYGYKYKPEEYEVTFERIGGMDVREKLLPLLLKQAGYVSGIYGKWDLGVHKRFLPLGRGFDDFYGFSNTGIDYFTHERYGVPSMFRDNQPTEEDKGTYCTYLFQREAIHFLKENHQKPFFLYLPFNAPHGASSLDPRIRGGAQAPEKYKKMYPHLKDTLVTKKKTGRYEYRETSKGPVIKQGVSPSKRRLEYVASITCMDDAIGEVLDLLDEYQIADNTIVVFFSDNGGGGGSDNSPLKGKKGMMFEGGIRVPCLVRYPKKIKPGTVNEGLLTSLELVPTFLNETGIPLPEDIVFDGYDMLPTLMGQTDSPRKEMYWQRRADKAARVGNWKWVESAKGNGLFDLSKDVSEKHDLSQTHPRKLQEMKAQFANWKKEMAESDPRGPFRDF
ncbi:sulfatase-like hydrolase/transferase [Gimesia fumaroli]|uniref:Arylsulfatase n=1 Tax=Gimesia fumaroli TaxID=2527976 RepID=A0A518IG66_9PLAN|nr:sulfatase-like hydrolase/transferase [Gimesia fumaroli]QDV52078.1 Arylsulfatase [Gimesia fumaroli]